MDIGFDVIYENINSENAFIDDGCLVAKSYLLRDINKNNVSSLSGISDFISSVNVDIEGRGQDLILSISRPINNDEGENAWTSGIAGIAIFIIIVVAESIFVIAEESEKWTVKWWESNMNSKSEKMPVEDI